MITEVRSISEYSIPLNHVFIPIQVPGSLAYCRFPGSQSGSVSVPILFSFKVALDIPGTLHFHIHFRIRMSTSIKKLVVMIGIMFDLQINTKRTDIVKII